MLSLRMGIWTSSDDQAKASGTFNILGKRFVIFVDKNDAKKGNSPDFWVTIKEYVGKD